MLPAIAVILWCNLLAVLANGYLKVLSMDTPAKRRQARWGLVGVSVLTLGLASRQTAEVVHEGHQVREKLESPIDLSGKQEGYRLNVRQAQGQTKIFHNAAFLGA